MAGSGGLGRVLTESPSQSCCRVAVWCRNSCRKRHEHRSAKCPRTVWDNRTVIGVVTDLPGWVEYLPRRRANQEMWRWPCVREAVGLDRVVLFRFARARGVQPQVPEL